MALLLSSDLPATLSPSVGECYADRMADHPNFEVRTAAEVRGTFTLSDGTDVCLELPTPVHPEESFAMIDLRDAEFAADVSEVFHDRWEQSEPLSLSFG